MPKVKNPLLSMEARGGIAGLVYNTWRGINTVKTNTSPTGQGTVKRLAAQALMIQASQLWKALDDAERDAWRQYAIDHPVADWTGSPKRLTGQNWFVGCTVQLLRVGNPSVDTPPVVAAPDAVVGLSLSQAGADLKVSWTTPVAAGPNVEFWLVGPLSSGVAAKLEQAKFDSSTGSATAQPFTLLVAPAIGRYTCFARVVDVDNGLVSTWVSDFLDIT